MAAPNIETLLDIETNIETAAKGFLQQATGLASTSAFASLDQDDLVLPRFSVRMELGEALDPPDIHASDLLEYLKYTGELVIEIVTDASIDGSQTDHRRYRGLVRGEMLRNACNFSSTNLPYYDVNYMRPSGTNFEVDGNIAISTISYAIQLKIKEDAFPTLGSPNYRTTTGTATTGETSTTTAMVSGTTSASFTSSIATSTASGTSTQTTTASTSASTTVTAMILGSTTQSFSTSTSTTGFTSACAT